jgi:hypothetical protein
MLVRLPRLSPCLLLLDRLYSHESIFRKLPLFAVISIIPSRFFSLSLSLSLSLVLMCSARVLLCSN